MEATATRTVTPNGAKGAIRHALKKQRPIFLWGPPGIGKSDIVRQITEGLGNSHLIDIRLSYGNLQILKAFLTLIAILVKWFGEHLKNFLQKNLHHSSIMSYCS